MNDEVDVFLDGNLFTKTISGEVVKAGVLTWKKELEIGKVLAGLLKEVPELTSRNLSSLTPDDLLVIIGSLLSKGLDEITHLVGVILDKDENWILENLDSEGVINLLVPFFFKRGKKYQEMWQNWGEKIKQLSPSQKL